jgi:hypothetical protein
MSNTNKNSNINRDLAEAKVADEVVRGTSYDQDEASLAHGSVQGQTQSEDPSEDLVAIPLDGSFADNEDSESSSGSDSVGYQCEC